MSQYTEFEINVDLTNVQEFSGGGTPAPSLPPGEYVLDLVNLVQGTSKTNNPKIEVTFEVVEGEYAGQKITNNYSMQQQALGRWKKLALACGAQLTKIVSAEFIGARIRASVVHNEGAPMMGQDGTPMPVRVFANIANERALEEVPVVAAPPPPVTRKTNGTPAARRA
jgi:hypothetical protein